MEKLKLRRKKIKVLFVCLGNICRSTMAQCVFTDMVKKEKIDHLFEIESAATSRDAIGCEPHDGTVKKLRKENIPVISHYAVQMTEQDYKDYDYLIGMDTDNIHNMKYIVGGDSEGKIYKLLSFTGSGRDVADPWYTGDFDTTYCDVVAGCKGFLEYLKAEGKI